MLVYANSLTLNPENGLRTLLAISAKWMGFRAKTAIDPVKLGQGYRSLLLKDGIEITSSGTNDAELNPTYPYHFCATFTHPDMTVNGRLWSTEIGIHQLTASAPFTCTILLKVDDSSALITAPINASRPRLVQMLVDQARPAGHTAGLKVKSVDLNSASAYLSECQRKDRTYPIILLSHADNKPDIVDLERLRSMLIGLADVVQIAPGTNTFTLSDILGKRFACYGGAINIIYPPRESPTGDLRIRTTLLTLQRLLDIQATGKTIENELLAIITHYTNGANAWRHITPAAVTQAQFQARLTQLLQRPKTDVFIGQLEEYTELLEIADQDIRSKDQELAALRQDYEERCDQVRILENDIDSLKYALNDKASVPSACQSADLSEIRNAISTVLSGNPTLQQVLQVISSLYPDRIVILPSAIDSARESDRGGFRHGHRAYNLLATFAEAYWQALASGKGDQIAKSCFGTNAFSSNEGEGLSPEGNRRRTFTYNGTAYRMIKHLKYGVKDSLADTLRIHYEWIAQEKRLVIGHCGKHLDF